MTKNMFWKEEYNVGVEQIDNAHQRLFQEVRRMERQIANDAYSKYDCIETIKFLKEYTLTHFAQEEAYMKSIGYSYFEMHKKLHDNLREATLPTLIENLRQRSFSSESIHEFSAVFAGWLAGHILIEDRAISGRAQSKFIRRERVDLSVEDVIDLELTQFMKDMLNIEIRLCNGLYDGHEIPKAFMFEATYNSRYHITMIVQYEMILEMVSAMIGVRMNTFDANAVLSFSQLATSIAKAILEIIYPDIDPQLTGQKGTVSIDFENYFAHLIPRHSMMWTSPKGIVALCVDELPIA